MEWLRKEKMEVEGRIFICMGENVAAEEELRR